MKEKVTAPQPIYKREMKFSDGKLVMNQITFVPVPKDFSDSLVSAMKDGGFWEDIVNVDGKDYMEEKRFNIYKKLSETLRKN